MVPKSRRKIVKSNPGLAIRRFENSINPAVSNPGRMRQRKDRDGPRLSNAVPKIQRAPLQLLGYKKPLSLLIWPSYQLTVITFSLWNVMFCKLCFCKMIEFQDILIKFYIFPTEQLVRMSILYFFDKMELNPYYRGSRTHIYISHRYIETSYRS